MALSKTEHNEICQKGMLVLKEIHAYTQVEVIGKMLDKGVLVSKSAFTNIMKGRGASDKMLMAAAKAIQEIIAQEFGMEWKDGHFIRSAGEDFAPQIIPIAKQSNFVLHKTGRLPIADKAAFFKEAHHEVIEFGLTLSRFSNNLSSGSRSEFRSHVEEVLQRGINFKCYLLNPEGNVASLYFEDRGKTHAEEKDYKRKILEAIARLRSIQDEFSQNGYPGSFEVYTYEHVPYGYFLVVDGGTDHCKMLASPYLYGIKRADTPVLEFNRKNDFQLYHTYWHSLTALMKNAKKIIPAQA